MLDLEVELAILKQYYPQGGVWQDINDESAELGILIKTFAKVVLAFKQYQDDIYQQLNLYKINEFIANWERFVGIPDDVIAISQDKEIRVKNIIFKIIGLKCKTIIEIKNIIQIMFNVNIDIIKKTNLAQFDYIFPVLLSNNFLDNLITIIRVYKKEDVNKFDYTFDFTLAGQDFIENIILSIAPFDKQNFIKFIYNNS